MLVLYPLPSSHYLAPKSDASNTTKPRYKKTKQPPIKKTAAAAPKAAQTAAPTLESGTPIPQLAAVAAAAAESQNAEYSDGLSSTTGDNSSTSAGFGPNHFPQQITMMQALSSATDDDGDIDQLLGTLLEVDNDTILSLLGTTVC